jgi:hypothetical protein
MSDVGPVEGDEPSLDVIASAIPPRPLPQPASTLS